MKKEEEKSIEPQSVVDFLKDSVEAPGETKEIHFKRFKSPFVIQELSATELSQLQEGATIKKKNRRTGTTATQLDQEQFSQDMIVKSVVTPNLRNAELQNSYGISPSRDSAVKTLYAMLTAGEYTQLSSAIVDLNGLNDDDSLDNLTDQAKK